MNAPYPKGSFTHESKVYKAGQRIFCSEMFPYLEPYTAAHELFFRQMVDNAANRAMPEASRSERLFVLLRDFKIVWMDDDGTWYRITIPAGFLTDVASIPLLVQWLFKMYGDGKIRPAALPHDLLYQMKELMRLHRVIDIYRDEVVTKAMTYRMEGQVLRPDEVPRVMHQYNNGPTWQHDSRVWSKENMDKFFLKIMNAYGNRLPGLTYWGVRLGGRLAYLHNDAVRHYTAALFDIDETLRNSWED